MIIAPTPSAGHNPERDAAEYVDRVGVEAARAAARAAVASHCAEVQREVWRRRRETLIAWLQRLEAAVSSDLRHYSSPR